mgnify:CR=1 FL=1
MREFLIKFGFSTFANEFDWPLFTSSEMATYMCSSSSNTSDSEENDDAVVENEASDDGVEEDVDNNEDERVNLEVVPMEDEPMGDENMVQ